MKWWVSESSYSCVDDHKNLKAYVDDNHNAHDVGDGPLKRKIW